MSTADLNSLDFARGPVTQQQLLDEARRRFGDDPLDIRFRCPSCGDVAAIRDFPDGKRDRAGQECIGRSLGALEGPPGAYHGRGCDWCAYGLFRGPLVVVKPDGGKIFGFPLAPVTFIEGQPAAATSARSSTSEFRGD